MWYMGRQPKKKTDRNELLTQCLHAFIQAGTLDLSLDQLARRVKISKRMLVHYFGGREPIERAVMALLEDRLRAQFSPHAFPAGIAPDKVITALWQRTIAKESRGVLLLIMDLSRRAWNGSKLARAFYDEQQRLWIELLLKFIPDRRAVEDILLVFQGAVFAFLITGDPEPGRRALQHAVDQSRS
jgi:AcrR family transcriptional regulator